MSAKLRDTLLQISGQPMLEQGKILDKAFEDWRGENPQVDDVTLIGVRY